MSPAAVATALPLEDAPVHRCGASGLTGSAWGQRCSANAASVICSVPSSTAPAASSRAITVASVEGTRAACSGIPPDVTTPATSASSFTATGMPCSTPRSTPRARSASAASAARTARSAVTTA